MSFWIGLNLLVNKGVAYPANAGERMAAEAAERMKKEGISRELVPFLCSYAIWENGELAETDMNDEEQAAAEEYRESGKDSGGYYHVKAEGEGKEAVLQFQYKMELINPEGRKLIPDVEKWYFIFWGAVLIVSLGLVTHRYVKIFRRRLSVLQDEMCIRDSSISVKKYDQTVDSMAFEVRSVDGSRLVENTEITNFRMDGENITADIVLKDLIDEKTEYSLTFLLNLEDGRCARYYTRIIQADGYGVKEKLAFVRDFSAATFHEDWPSGFEGNRCV